MRRTLDTEHYAIVGYNDVPTFSLPDRAMPHLLEPNHALTRCGKAWDSLLTRSFRTWKKPICRNCIKEEER